MKRGAKGTSFAMPKILDGAGPGHYNLLLEHGFFLAQGDDSAASYLAKMKRRNWGLGMKDGKTKKSNPPREPFYSIEAESMITQNQERRARLKEPHTRRISANELVVAGGKRFGFKFPREGGA